MSAECSGTDWARAESSCSLADGIVPVDATDSLAPASPCVCSMVPRICSRERSLVPRSSTFCSSCCRSMRIRSSRSRFCFVSSLSCLTSSSSCSTYTFFFSREMCADWRFRSWRATRRACFSSSVERRPFLGGTTASSGVLRLTPATLGGGDVESAKPDGVGCTSSDGSIAGTPRSVIHNNSGPERRYHLDWRKSRTPRVYM